jgi:co-chaperonin GroES (HSP10)
MLKPKKENYLIKVRPETTTSGIILPDSTKPTWEADIIEAGSGCEFKKGEVAVLPKLAGKELEFNGDKYRVVSESMIHGVLI